MFSKRQRYSVCPRSILQHGIFGHFTSLKWTFQADRNWIFLSLQTLPIERWARLLGHTVLIEDGSSEHDTHVCIETGDGYLKKFKNYALKGSNYQYHSIHALNYSELPPFITNTMIRML